MERTQDKMCTYDIYGDRVRVNDGFKYSFFTKVDLKNMLKLLTPEHP